jgi:hypothetical protein
MGVKVASDIKGEHRRKIFEKRMLRRTFGSWKNCSMRSFITSTLRQI